MKSFKLVIALALSMFLLVACGSPSDMKASVLSAGSLLGTPNEVNQILTGGGISNLQIIDVRTPAEFATGCLSPAKNIDLKSPDFVERISSLDKNASYLVYCRSGGRSAEAAAQMKEAGFNNIIELKGGIINWETEGYSLSQNCVL